MKAQTICSVSDLVPNSGVCALVEHDGTQTQVALFYLPDTEQKIFALGNWDPLGQANVMSRGIVGNVGEEWVVASPLYKQHFSLTSGQCLEEDACLPVFNVSIDDGLVFIKSQTEG